MLTHSSDTLTHDEVRKLGHNPSRAAIHAHVYGVLRGDIAATPTMRAMAHALNRKLLATHSVRS